MSEVMPPNKPENRTSDLVTRAALRVARVSLQLYMRAMYGGDGKIRLDNATRGLTEGSIIAPQLCHPSYEAQGALVLSRAPAGRMLGYDFRRPDYLPAAARLPGFTQEYEGVLYVHMTAEAITGDPDTLPDSDPPDYFTPDMVFSFDKPGLDRLIEVGMLFPRTHEQAYEVAGQTKRIDGLRARGVADTTVYQVARKAHMLVFLAPDNGQKTPRKREKPSFVTVPGVLAH